MATHRLPFRMTGFAACILAALGQSGVAVAEPAPDHDSGTSGGGPQEQTRVVSWRR